MAASIPISPDDGLTGIYGAVRGRIAEFPLLVEKFGTRVHPGQQPPGTPLPYVVFTLVNATNEYDVATRPGTAEVIYINIWYTHFQVSVYAVGYETARDLSKLLHQYIDRKEMLVDCVIAIPYVETRGEILDPRRSEDGREVWQFFYRYEIRIPELVGEELPFPEELPQVDW